MLDRVETDGLHEFIGLIKELANMDCLEKHATITTKIEQNWNDFYDYIPGREQRKMQKQYTILSVPPVKLRNKNGIHNKN